MPATLHSELLLTELDRARLLKLNPDDLPEPLQDLLKDVSTVPSPSIPPHVVTMYSQVLVSHPGDPSPQTLTLCYPKDAAPQEGRVSVLSPVGAALLGQPVGATVAWTSPDGKERGLRIDALLFQPEASGDYTR